MFLIQKPNDYFEFCNYQDYQDLQVNILVD